MELPDELLSRLEQLRHHATVAFPAAVDVPAVVLGGGVRGAWTALASAARVTSAELATAIGRALGMPSLEAIGPIDLKLAHLVPEGLARELFIVPLQRESGRLVVATAMPFDTAALQRFGFAANLPLTVQVAAPELVEGALSTLYRRAAEHVASRLGELRFVDSERSGDGVSESAIVQLTRGLILEALKVGASDLHAQPHAGGGLIRIRVDGVLRRQAQVPAVVLQMMSRYIKAQAGMDPTTDRVAQDGRLSVVLPLHDIDVRVSILPASRGESLVMRFLDQRKVFRLSNSGFSRMGLLSLRRMIGNASGLVLVTGPTGCGKSSTLYGMLSEINEVGVSVVTVENPVEYRMSGVAQVDVNAAAGLDFSSALRSILRQDPNVILVGEIRDRETAQIAVQAALTGHLVLSTMHTNDALTAIPRLVNLGIDAPVLADALVGVAAQRLLRRLCESCRIPVSLPLTVEEAALQDVMGQAPAYRAVGCAACGGTGFKGRFPVLEVAEMTDEMHACVAAGRTAVEDLRAITKGVLTSMGETAAHRIVSGDTTVREAVRVVGVRFWSDLSRAKSRPIPRDALQLFATDESSGEPVVLVVAGDADWARQIADALEREHFRAVVARSPDEAREVLESNEDVAFMVIDADPGDGADVLKHVASLRVALGWSRLPYLPIIRSEDADLQRMMEDFGVVDYLQKPVTPTEVAARARTVYLR